MEALELRLALRSRLRGLEFRGRHGVKGNRVGSVLRWRLLGAVFTEMPHTVSASSRAIEEMC